MVAGPVSVVTHWREKETHLFPSEVGKLARNVREYHVYD